MEAVARFVSGVKFEIESRGHRIVSDQPLDNGGIDAGMTPPELLLGALASCAGFYAVQYLKARALPVKGVNAKVTADKATQPARLGAFRIELETPPLEPKHAEGLLRAVKSCLVHNTLKGNPSIEVVQSGSVEAIEPRYGDGVGAAPAGWRA